MKKLIVGLLLSVAALTYAASLVAVPAFNTVKTREIRDLNVLHYDGDYFQAIGTNEAVTFIPAIRLTPIELAEHYGKSLTKVQLQVHGTDYTSVTLKVYEGASATLPGTELCSQVLTIAPDALTEYSLTTPVPLQAGKDYWIGYEVVATGGCPAGVDAGPVAALGKSNMINFGGVWTPMSAIAPTLTGNWNIRAVVEGTPGTDILPPAVISLTGNQGQPGNPLNLSLKVVDQSATPATFEASYNIGAGDVPFTMTKGTKKGESTYGGTIPAQAAGTIGSVKFHVADSAPAANNAWTTNYNISWPAPAVYKINENFEACAAPELPAGWTVADVNADGKQWKIGAPGNNSVYALQMSFSDDVAMDDWVFTPLFTAAANKKYVLKYSYKGMNNFNERFEIKYGNAATPEAMTNALVLPTETEGFAYTNDSASFVITSPQDVVVGIHGISDVSKFWLFIDDISIREESMDPDFEAPVAATPVGVEAVAGNPINISTFVTDQTGIASVVGHYQLSGQTVWNDFPMTAAKAFGTYTGTIPAQATAITGKVKFTTTDNFTPANSGDSPEFNIKWISPSDVEFFEFEHGLPESWSLLDADGDGNNWTTETTPAYEVHSGTKGFHSLSYINGGKGALTPDNFMIINKRMVGADAKLKFWVSAQDAAWAEEHYGVAISTTGTAATYFTMLYEETMSAKGHGNWHEQTVTIPSSYIGQEVYLAFRHFNCTDMFAMNLDDVTLYYANPVGIDNESTPMMSSLNQNYPNPFNPTTSINYTTNLTGSVKLTVMNAKGETVATLVNNSVAAGNHSVSFDGSKFNSGVYFYKLTTPNSTITKKMLLVK